MYQGGSRRWISKVEGQHDPGSSWTRAVDMLKDTITERFVSVVGASCRLTVRSILMLVVDVKCLGGTAHHGGNMTLISPRYLIGMWFVPRVQPIGVGES